MGTLQIPLSVQTEADLRAMMTVRGSSGREKTSLEEFCAEILQCEIAGFRAAKIRALSLRELQRPAPEVKACRDRRQRLKPETIQGILHLSAELNKTQLAKRFNVGTTTVTRILREYGSREHLRPSTMGRGGAGSAN